MKTTEILLELLKYIVPAGLVLGAVAVVLRENRQKAEMKERYRVLKGTLDQIVPLKLQAYERAILFLERISPENLLLRVGGHDKTVQLFQMQLTMEIRAEFEHNISQQLYIESESWGVLVRAKEQIIALIHQVAKTLPADAVGSELTKRVLNEMVKQESVPAREGIVRLKQDVSRMFRLNSASE